MAGTARVDYLNRVTTRPTHSVFTRLMDEWIEREREQMRQEQELWEKLQAGLDFP